VEIQATKIFEKNWNALQDNGVRFLVNQGGSRSSKTYSLCQLIIVYCLKNPDKVVSIVRKTFPALRATVMRDFFEIMKDLNLYEKANHNMSENIYKFPNGSMVEFFSVDDEQKIRGRKARYRLVQRS
jgi:phage terminase large subunit